MQLTSSSHGLLKWGLRLKLRLGLGLVDVDLILLAESLVILVMGVLFHLRVEISKMSGLR